MRNRITEQVNRISWGGVIAGTVTAFAISTMLNFLGMGIGFAAIDPLNEVHPLAGLGIGTIIWWGISNLIALFAGGYIAGRVSGYPSKQDGSIHGFLSWALYGVLSFFLITSAASSAISGIGGAIGSIFGDSSGKQVMVNLKNAQGNSKDAANSTLEDIKKSIYNVASKAEKMEILPDDATEEMRETQNNLKAEGQDALNKLDIDQAVNEFVSDLEFNIDDNGDLHITSDGDILDKKGLKQYLINNTELSEQEIDGIINKWETKIENGIDKAEQLYAEAKQKAIEIADKTAAIASKVAISAFVILLLGAIAASLGGGLGSPHHLVREDDYYENEDSERIHRERRR